MAGLANHKNPGLIGGTGGDHSVTAFNNLGIGIRGHVQHVKTCASPESLVREVIDPRFCFDLRGIEPLLIGPVGSRNTSTDRLEWLRMRHRIVPMEKMASVDFRFKL
jgi:hypothetical protein